MHKAEKKSYFKGSCENIKRNIHQPHISLSLFLFDFEATPQNAHKTSKSY